MLRLFKKIFFVFSGRDRISVRKFRQLGNLFSQFLGHVFRRVRKNTLRAMSVGEDLFSSALASSQTYLHYRLKRQTPWLYFTEQAKQYVKHLTKPFYACYVERKEALQSAKLAFPVFDDSQLCDGSLVLTSYGERRNLCLVAFLL